MKICPRCKKEKDRSEFAWRGKYIDPYCRECRKEYERERGRRRAKTEPEKLRERRKIYCLRHPDRRKESVKKWNESNKDRQNATHTRYAKRRKEYDPAFRLHLNLHNQIWASLKQKKNWTSWTRILGYTAKDLKIHLEAKFKEGMTWNNYGDWHIDHIVPKKRFTPDQIKECWALTNLQPLWASENCSKGARLMQAGMMKGMK